MISNQVNFEICPIELAHLDSVEQIANLSKDGIRPNTRMIYYLGCTIFKRFGLVLKVDDQVVGFILGFPGEDDQTVWIHQIAINPDFRGKGYGNQLMKAFFELADQDNAMSLQLAANPNNTALHWYIKLGFQEIDLSEEIGMIILEKNLKKTENHE